MNLGSHFAGVVGDDDALTLRPGDYLPAEGDDEGEAPPEDAPAEAAAALPEMDEGLRAQVEAYYAQREQQQRDALRAYGLDVTNDGQPVIADPGRFAAWSGAGRSPQPAAAAPAPAPAARETPDELPELDPLAMTGADLARYLDVLTDRKIQPYQEEAARLREALARRSANDALATVRDALSGYPPEIQAVTDHPDFAEAYRRLAAQTPPEQLEDPRMKATIALQIAPWLQAPEGMTMREQPERAQPRDTQGRFVPAAEVARNQAARQSLGQMPPARSGHAAPAPADRESRQLQGFLAAFGEYVPKAKGWGTSEAELEALSDPNPLTQWERFQAARAAGKQGGRR